MDCVKVEVKQETTVKKEVEDNTCLFDGNNDTNDPFNNLSDKSIYDDNSDNDPFKEDDDDPFEVNNTEVDKIPQEASILNESVVKETSSKDATLKDYIYLPNYEYGCKHCDYVTKNRQNVFLHLKRHHMNYCRPVKQCPHCPFKAQDLKTHILYRHKKDSEIDWFECHQCGYKCKEKQNLINHLLSHKTYEEKLSSMIKCIYCPKMFQLKHELRKHIRKVHDENKPDEVTCYLCSQKYCEKKTLIKHINRCHVSLAIQSCRRCDFKTKVPHLYYQHLKVHLIKRFQCEKCVYQTHNKGHMKLHEINHQEVKNEKDLKYRCDKCDYKTYRDYSLRVHKLKHLKPEEIQYFHCYYCEFKAKRKDNLKVHIKNLHFKKQAEFVCFVCDFKTNTKVSHIAHLGKHSREQKEEIRILNADHDDEREKGKRQISSSNNKSYKAPLKRRKVVKNDDDTAVKPEIK